MKTLAELYNEICADESLKEQLKAAAEENKVEEFFKAHGCEATADEVKDFIGNEKEVSLDELDMAAGGYRDMDGTLSARPHFACIGIVPEMEIEGDRSIVAGRTIVRP